jgi:hypothetical protein
MNKYYMWSILIFQMFMISTLIFMTETYNAVLLAFMTMFTATAYKIWKIEDTKDKEQ